ncbi:MAG: hypothetical protein AB8G26_02570, partial [Ilumatobacter sp.]
MRTRQTSARSARRLAALLTAMALVTAACGSDDEGSSDNAAPDWATNPDKVRQLKENSFPEGALSANLGCSFVPERIATVGVVADNIINDEGLAFVSSDDEDAQPHQDIGVYLYETTDPIAASVALLNLGVQAAPVYNLFPTPARMFFPGTLPVPSTEPLPDPGSLGADVGVAVF